MRKCNHNPNSSKTSIMILPEEFMVYPPQKFGICPICEKQFTFIVKDNKLVLKEEKKHDANE